MATVSKSESVLKEILDLYFKCFKNLDNIHPDWLEGLEVDRYYPELGVIVEFQGPHHYKDYNQIRADSKKRNLVQAKGIKFYDINIYDLTEDRIRRLIEGIIYDGKNFLESSGKEYLTEKLVKIDPKKSVDPKLLRLATKLALPRYKK